MSEREDLIRFYILEKRIVCAEGDGVDKKKKNDGTQIVIEIHSPRSFFGRPGALYSYCICTINCVDRIKLLTTGKETNRKKKKLLLFNTKVDKMYIIYSKKPHLNRTFVMWTSQK